MVGIRRPRMEVVVPTKSKSMIADVIDKEHDGILADWLAQLKGGHGLTGRLREGELETHARELLGHFRRLVHTEFGGNIESAEFDAVREQLGNISRSRAAQSFTPSETATFIFSLKQPLMERLGRAVKDAAQLQRELWNLTLLIDRLGLYTTDVFQKSREQLIQRQQQELAELSTPVVRLWKGILAMPLIGTLDSERTQ